MHYLHMSRKSLGISTRELMASTHNVMPSFASFSAAHPILATSACQAVSSSSSTGFSRFGKTLSKRHFGKQHRQIGSKTRHGQSVLGARAIGTKAGSVNVLQLQQQTAVISITVAIGNQRQVSIMHLL